MQSETIQYIPKELQDRLIALGFTELSERTVSREGKAFTEYGITLEQAERFIWKIRGERFFPEIILHNGVACYWWSVPGIDTENNDPVEFYDPFSARLAGVERVIEILGKGKSQ